MACGCGCLGSALAAIDPLERFRARALETMGGVDGGECDSISVHLSGEAIDDFKARLSPWFESTAAAIAACGGLAPEERAAWSLFYASWIKHRDTKTSWFFAFEAWRATCIFARSLDAWRQKLAGTACVVPGPSTIDVPKSETASVVKWVAGAAIVVALAYGIGVVTKVIP